MRQAGKPDLLAACWSIVHRPFLQENTSMRRFCSRIPQKFWLALALLVAGGVFWFGYGRVSASRKPPAKVDLADAPGMFQPEFEYTVHDGKVHDGASETSEQQQPDAPGKVDALDMRQAYERASRLAA